jgi:hypothetical protein
MLIVGGALTLLGTGAALAQGETSRGPEGAQAEPPEPQAPPSSADVVAPSGPSSAPAQTTLLQAARMQSSAGPSEATMAASTAHLGPADGPGEDFDPFGAQAAQARARAERAGTAQRHEGFFLRLVAGAGAGTARYQELVDGTKSQVEDRGLTGLLELSVGASVHERLVLHGNVLVTGFGDARRTVRGLPDASQRPSTTTTMVGAGTSYYFPLNVYLTGSLGVAWFDESRTGPDFRSGAGFGLCVATGKEWWVGRTGEWGIGASLRGGMSVGPSTLSGLEMQVRTGHIAIAVSATLN